MPCKHVYCMQGRKLQHPGCLKHRQLSFAVLPIHSKLFACPLRWVEIGSTLHSYSPFSTHLLRWAALRNCTNSAHAHIPVAVLGLLDLPDPCQGLPPPTNFKFLARAQKGSGNETSVRPLISNSSRVRRKGLGTRLAVAVAVVSVYRNELEVV